MEKDGEPANGVAFAIAGGIVDGLLLWGNTEALKTLDAGWAALIGSALGAAITVWGALYLTKRQSREEKRQQASFVKEVLENLHDESQFLLAVCGEEHSVPYVTNREEQLEIAKQQLRSYQHAVAVFERDVAEEKLGDYNMRLQIVKLDAVVKRISYFMVEDVEPLIEFEFWKSGAKQIIEATEDMASRIGWAFDGVMPDLVKDRVKNLFLKSRAKD